MSESNSSPSQDTRRLGEEEIALEPSMSKPTIVPLAEKTPLLRRESDAGKTSLRLSLSWVNLSGSLRKLRSATTTVSLIESQSDDRSSNAFLAGWNVTSLIQGTGMLGIPYAVKLGGWAAIASILVCGFLCCYTGKLLIDCLYVESKSMGQRRRVRVNFPEIGKAVWPGWGHKIVTVVQVCEMSGAAVTYVILMASIFFDFLQHATALDIYDWTVIVGCLVFPGVFITRVSFIAWLSMLSVFSLFSAILTTIIYCITQYEQMTIDNMPSFHLSSFLVGFGIIMFSFTAHTVLPGVEASMQKPKQYPAMLNVAFANSTISKIALGMLGVLRFGPELKQAVTINLKNNAVFYILANAFVVANVILAFPLLLFDVFETWDNKILPYFPHLARGSTCHWFWLLLTRPLILTFGVFLAIAVPHFGLVMGLLGCLTGTTLCFIFPCVFHLKLKWNKLAWYQVAFRIAIAVFGIACGVLGASFSALKLVTVGK